MKRFPMMLQLVFILFFVMIIPMAIMTWYSGMQILGNSEKAIAESTLAGLESNKSLNESALRYIAQDTVRLASSSIFDDIRSYKSYEQLNLEYHRVEHALLIVKELQRLTRSNDGVYSSFFYLQDSNYIISSDKGVTLLDRYEETDWLQAVISEQDGIAGVWHTRKTNTNDMMLSYILPLNRLSTSTKGILVINLLESQISNYMNTPLKTENSYYIIDTSSQTIISHEDKSLLLADATKFPYLMVLLQQKADKGFIFNEENGERRIYTWSRSNLTNWLYTNIYSMDKLMSQTRDVQQNIIVFTTIIITIGTVLTVLIATWLSKPLRMLVRNIQNRSNLSLDSRNELDFLDNAFHTMQEDKEKLNQLIIEHEQDANSLAIHHLLNGDSLDNKKIKETFPEPNYIVAIVSIDQYSKYMNKTSPETRSYHRYSFFARFENYQNSNLCIKAVHHGESNMALVVNICNEEKESLIRLYNEFEQISIFAMDIFGHSVTIGVSSLTNTTILIPEKLFEAMELVKQRMIEGNGRIISWKKDKITDKKYIYPLNSERKILNFMNTGEFESILVELHHIRGVIERAEYISYDNILFIYNQLVGVTIKQLNEKNISSSAIFSNRDNIYSTIATMDTLDELESYLSKLFKDICLLIQSNLTENNHVDKIVTYLELHYCKDIVFEDMAKTIGISYSYMRKLLYEATGKSLIDYINYKRIQKAKELLISTSLTISQIALEVGYQNIQSFHRFFRKYEGVTPSNYKMTK